MSRFWQRQFLPVFVGAAVLGFVCAWSVVYPRFYRPWIVIVHEVAGGGAILRLDAQGDPQLRNGILTVRDRRGVTYHVAIGPTRMATLVPAKEVPASQAQTGAQWTR